MRKGGWRGRAIRAALGARPTSGGTRFALFYVFLSDRVWELQRVRRTLKVLRPRAPPDLRLGDEN